MKTMHNNQVALGVGAYFVTLVVAFAELPTIASTESDIL